LGFYFAPSYGYYRVPSSYYNYRYRRGEYLPTYFLSYRISDPYEYGLDYPPYGTAYVWVNNCIVLVDLYDYQIIEIYNDLY
jgi:Ni/Co efflux regulator RcnB